MIEVKLVFKTFAEASAFFSRDAAAPSPAVPVELLAGAMALNDIPAEVQQAAAPARKPRAKKEDKIAEAPAQAVADAAPAAVAPEQEATAEQLLQPAMIDNPAVAYTVDEVRKALQAYSGVHGFPAATELVKSFGATRITELDPKDYAAFIAKTEEEVAA